MRISVPALLLVMLAAGAIPAAPIAMAQPYPREHMRDQVRSGEIRSLDRILPSIRRSHPGTFYDAEGPVPAPDGSYRYRLKWMTPDGRIVWLETDARTGRVLGVQGARSGPNSSPGNRPDPRNYFQDRYGARHGMDGGPLDSRNEETRRSGRNSPARKTTSDRGWNRDGNWPPRSNSERRER